MKFSTLAVAFVALEAVAGHTLFTTLFVDDVDQGDGTCVRMPMTPNTATDPINNLAGEEMACGYGGTTGVARVCPVSQSSKLGFIFREYPDNSQPGAIDTSHKGPCAVYMKSVSSPTTDKAIGDGWFKIWDNGYDATTSQWCTEKLMKNNGLLSVNIPADLAGGSYLVRPELLSLHEADKSPPNPQFYAGCAQIFLNSKATAKPQQTVSIPGYVSINDPTVLFNIYTPKWPYSLPGPARYTSGSIATGGINIAEVAPSQTEGLVPGNAILTNANWWGVEVASYSTEDGCNAAATSCWNQCTICYNTAPPTGDKNCRVWESKCQGISDACQSGNFNGPSNAGKNLSPQVVSGTAPASDSTEPVAPTTSSTPTPLSIAILPTPSAPPTSTASNLTVSLDASCGKDTNQTCLNSEYGSCCSNHGWCGSNDDYCGSTNCQPEFGKCDNMPAGGKAARRRRQRRGNL